MFPKCENDVAKKINQSLFFWPIAITEAVSVMKKYIILFFMEAFAV